MKPRRVGGALRVLVLDEDGAERRALARALLARGHHCDEAVSVAAALALLRARLYHVILVRAGAEPVAAAARALHVDTRYAFVLALGPEGSDRVDGVLTTPIDWTDLDRRLKCAARLARLHRSLAARLRRALAERDVWFSAARIDPVTGLGNRRRMDEDIRGAVERVRRYGEQACVALCDLDGFKAHNDRKGHAAGDRTLSTVARALERALRRADALYRYGGDEFAALLERQNLDEAVVAMERARLAVARRGLTISVGVAELRGRDGAVECLRRADAALYLAKARGRNRVVVDRHGALASVQARAARPELDAAGQPDVRASSACHPQTAPGMRARAFANRRRTASSSSSNTWAAGRPSSDGRRT